MAQVAPAERDLRRVIGDGGDLPDGEVEGLAEADLLAIYRSMVLLRTYDERSVVYHRQGRIGTYAIYWGHEAIQAGAVHAPGRRGLDLPVLPRVGGRPAARHAARDNPRLVARASCRLVESRASTASPRSPSRSRPMFRTRSGLRGERSSVGRAPAALAFFGDGATSEGAFHEGANLAAVMAAPAILLCNNNGWAISTPVSAQTRAETLADKARGYGMPGRSRRRRRRPRRLRGDLRGCRARPRGERPDVHRGGHLPDGAPRDSRRPERVHRRGPRRARARERVPRPLRPLPTPFRRPRRRALRTRSAGRRSPR